MGTKLNEIIEESLSRVYREKIAIDDPAWGTDELRRIADEVYSHHPQEGWEKIYKLVEKKLF